MGTFTWIIGGSARRARALPRAGRWLAAGAALALLGGAIPASAQTSTWSVVHSPNRRAGGNYLDAVSCVSASACMATGHRLNSIGALVTLAETWNGTKWSLVRSPNRGRGGNELVAVSCVSAGACEAVGFTQGGPGGTLAESWNGARWSVVPAPSPGSTGSDLTGVSCVSADACTAVGTFSTNGNALSTLVESWDGTHWSVVPSPNPVAGGGFSGVSCTSADACMAVGFSGSESGTHATLAESWDGTRWTVVPTPSPSANDFLNGVSCVSASACTAAGNAFHTGGPTTGLIESWDGTRWSVVPSRSPGVGQTEVNGVSCASKDACAVVGYYDTKTDPARAFVETWDGSSWSVVPVPNPGIIDHIFNGVSCVSADVCTAAGYFYSHRNYRTLIESGPVAR